MKKSLTDYSTLTFDCYGTLIDWESGIWDAYQPLLMANQCDTIDRQQALVHHAKLESGLQKAEPGLIYPSLLARVHGEFALSFDLKSSDAMDQKFGASVPLWPAFPDTADALRYLKSRFRLVILSNIDNMGFAASNEKLGVEFDAIYTAELIGSYKPDHQNFEFMLDNLKRDLGVEKQDILHTAQSLFHDHVPVREFGLANAWIDRQGLHDGGNWGATARVDGMPGFDFLFPTMDAMAQAVRAA